MRSLTLLYVEDHKLLLLYVKQMLESQGWRVDACRDGQSALEKIGGASHYDLLLLDKSLPGLDGLELVRRARNLTHRRRTPIIVLSADNCERAALQAGVDLCLKKPEDIDAIVSSIKRLTSKRAHGTRLG
jgi:two-component system response regulator TctD